jgi:hypothetical protein
MHVETFECQETAAEPIEATEEAVRLMEEMGLAGQMELVRPKTDETFAARSPYRLITAEEQFVYSTLCPEKVRFERYNAGPIPLRVLQIAAHFKTLQLHKRLEVWDKVSSLVQDPVLVAHAHDEYEWNGDKRRTWILARWGEVLEAFSVLRKQAVAVHRESVIASAVSLVKRAECATDEELMQRSVFTW